VWAWYCSIVTLSDACTPIGSKNKSIYICVVAVCFQISGLLIFFLVVFLFFFFKIKGDKNSGAEKLRMVQRTQM